MLRIAKLTDYSIVLLTHVAKESVKPMYNARDLAKTSHVPAPTVSKLLKMLSKAGLLVSHRGVKGGYSLAKPPAKISVADIIAAIEGPVALTDCSSTCPGLCDIETWCPVRGNWQRINQVVVKSLANLTLLDMTRSLELPRASPTRSQDGAVHLVHMAQKAR